MRAIERRALQSEAMLRRRSIRSISSNRLNPSFILRRDAGEDSGEGLNGLNDLNVLMRRAYSAHLSIDTVSSSFLYPCIMRASYCVCFFDHS
jgi:hypothetical protein